MGEPKAWSIEFEDPRRNRRRQSRVDLVADSRFHKGHCRVDERRDSIRNLEPGRFQTIEARLDAFTKIRWYGQLLIRRECASLALQSSGKFKYEEWISARCFREFDQRRTRQGQVKASLQELANRTKAQTG